MNKIKNRCTQLLPRHLLLLCSENPIFSVHFCILKLLHTKELPVLTKKRRTTFYFPGDFDFLFLLKIPALNYHYSTLGL
jgi:hypothetical protein